MQKSLLFKSKIIAVNIGFMNIAMINPVIRKKVVSYETEEGCSSLTGVRKTTRYQEIGAEYFDRAWNKQRQKYTGWIVQIIKHECYHLKGIII